VSSQPPVRSVILTQLEVALEHDGGDRLDLAIARSWTVQERTAYQRWRELWRTYVDGVRQLRDGIAAADWSTLKSLPDQEQTGP